MALYEEEVSAEENGKIELKPQTGFDISLFSPSLALSLFLPKPPACWLTDGVPLPRALEHETRSILFTPGAPQGGGSPILLPAGDFQCSLALFAALLVILLH